MLFILKPWIGKKHHGDFLITVILMRSGKTAKYIIKVDIEKFTGAIDSTETTISFSRALVDKFGILYLNVSVNNPYIIH
jgi:hypothetical protein